MLDTVTLNVGGTIFENIPLRNLRLSPVFDAQITRWDNSAATRDELGHICLQRDPKIFSLILQYLRYLEPDFQELAFESEETEEEFNQELDELCIATYEQRLLETFETAPSVPLTSLINKWREHGPVDLSKIKINKEREIKTTRMGNLFFEGQVNQAQKYDGLVRRIWLKDDGSYEIYEGQMRNGQAYGWGRRIMSNDDVYEGQWLNGSTMQLIGLAQELIVGEEIKVKS